MPTIKIYSIVTNDKYELPVGIELEGAKAVGEYLGITENAVRLKIFRGSWSKQRYKACVIGVKHTDRKAYLKEYGRKRIEMEKLKTIKEYAN